MNQGYIASKEAAFKERRLGAYLHRGRISLAYEQQQRDRVRALLRIFEKGEETPKGFRKSLPPRTYPEDQLTRISRGYRVIR